MSKLADEPSAFAVMFALQLNEWFACSDPSDERSARRTALETARRRPQEAALFALEGKGIIDVRLLAASVVTEVHFENLQRGQRALSNVFTKMVRHSDAMIREGVVYGLGRVDGRIVEPTLKIFLSDADTLVREAAEDELERRKALETSP